MKRQDIQKLFEEHRQVATKTEELLTETIHQFVVLITDALCQGHKLLIFGNGGSAADAQHVAGEFVSRFKMERRGLPAIALTTDTSILTAIGNDYGFDRVFSRQVEALANPGDVVFGITTSGKAMNVLQAMEMARQKGAVTLGLTGEKGNHLADAVDYCLMVPSANTPRIQEMHITILHILCELVEREIVERSDNAP